MVDGTYSYGCWSIVSGILPLWSEEGEVKMPSSLGSPLGRGRYLSFSVWGRDSLGVEPGVKNTPMRALVIPGGTRSPGWKSRRGGLRANGLPDEEGGGGGGGMLPPGPLKPRQAKKRKTKKGDLGVGAIPDPFDQ